MAAEEIKYLGPEATERIIQRVKSLETADGYTFSGTYRWANGVYSVQLDEYSFDDIVDAWTNNHPVRCLLWDDSNVYPILFTPASLHLDYGFAVLNAMGEIGSGYELVIYYDGNCEMNALVLTTKTYVDNKTANMVDEVLAALPTWEGGSY